MVICSAKGNATTTQPHQGFQEPQLAQIFATRVSSNKTTSVTTLPTSVHSQRKLPIGAIAGGIAGGFVLLFLIALFYFRGRRHVPENVPEHVPEFDPTLVELRAQQDGVAYELHNDSKGVFELPSAPVPLLEKPIK